MVTTEGRWRALAETEPTLYRLVRLKLVPSQRNAQIARALGLRTPSALDWHMKRLRMAFPELGGVDAILSAAQRAGVEAEWLG